MLECSLAPLLLTMGTPLDRPVSFRQAMLSGSLEAAFWSALCPPATCNSVQVRKRQHARSATVITLPPALS